MNTYDNLLKNALICTETGEKYNAEYRPIVRTITGRDVGGMQCQGWKTNWSTPHQKGYEIYALYIENDDKLQGMIALKHVREQYYTHVFCTEVAPQNKGDHKKYKGVNECLLAVACKLSWDAGNEGYLLFDIDSPSLQYGMEELNAIRFVDNTMYLDSYGAVPLIDKYFKEANSLIVSERKDVIDDQPDRLLDDEIYATMIYCREIKTYRLREAILVTKEINQLCMPFVMTQYEVL